MKYLTNKDETDSAYDSEEVQGFLVTLLSHLNSTFKLLHTIRNTLLVIQGMSCVPKTTYLGHFFVKSCFLVQF